MNLDKLNKVSSTGPKDQDAGERVGVGGYWAVPEAVHTVSSGTLSVFGCWREGMGITKQGGWLRCESMPLDTSFHTNRLGTDAGVLMELPFFVRITSLSTIFTTCRQGPGEKGLGLFTAGVFLTLLSS